MANKGSLVCVGLGMMLGAHISARTRSEIEHADVVFALVSDAIVELWLQEMRDDVRSLQPYYVDGKRRTDSYREMIAAMLTEVRAGHRVCGVFYGHPGVFAQVPHHAIAQARAEGFEAQMHPGISAEDCLYADLGIDPGTHGCQHYEASQLMFYRRQLDLSACLILWQIGIAGDRSLARFETGRAYRELLVELLIEAGYPPEHTVTVYQAATLPISSPRIEPMPLSALPEAELSLHSTLVLPPAKPMERNQAVLVKIARLEAAELENPVTSGEPAQIL